MRRPLMLSFAALALLCPELPGATHSNAAREAGTRAASVPTQTLMLTGDPAPDGNGTLSRPESLPTINDAGEVAVVVELAGTAQPGVDDFGIYLFTGQGPTKLVRSGEPVPNGIGTFKFFAYDPNHPVLVALNDSRQVAFSAELDDTPGIFTDNSGLFGADPTEGVVEYVRISDAAPDGNGVFGLEECCRGSFVSRALSPPGLDEDGRIAFHGYLTGTTGGEEVDDFGIFLADGSSTVRLLRLGQPEPFGEETIDRIDPAFANNAAGQVAIKADIQPDFPPPPFLQGPPPGPVDFERIYVGTLSLLQRVFTSGGAPPDGDGLIGMMERTRIADNGNLTFEAFVDDTDDFLDSGPRLFFYNGVTLREIVRQGQAGPGEVNRFFVSFHGLDSNSRDEVAFSARLERPPTEPLEPTTAIYRWNGSALTVLARQGDPAPDGNGTFGDLSVPVFINDLGQIAFSAVIEGSTTPPSVLSDFGVFVVEKTGEIHQAARSGQTLAGLTLKLPLFIGSLVDEQVNGALRDSDLRLAGFRPLNDRGKLVFTGSLDDDGAHLEGLFVWGPPSLFADDFEEGTFDAWSNIVP